MELKATNTERDSRKKLFWYGLLVLLVLSFVKNIIVVSFGEVRHCIIETRLEHHHDKTSYWQQYVQVENRKIDISKDVTYKVGSEVDVIYFKYYPKFSKINDFKSLWAESLTHFFVAFGLWAIVVTGVSKNIIAKMVR